RLTLRALQGFTQSLRDLAFPSLPVPNYTTLCRRAKTLDIELPILRDNEPIYLVVDSTGLKVYGEGEWKVRQHSYSKRRTWRKVHLALNANTGQVHPALMTHQNVADGDALAKLLDQIPREEQIDVIGGDGAYDTKRCHAAIAARSAIPSIPSREGTVHWPAALLHKSSVRRNRALLHKSNVRTPWHRTGIIQAIRTDCGRARSAMRLMTPTRTA
ncbi:MAG: IS5 family transposase, partial [Burkholderia sp.]